MREYHGDPVTGHIPERAGVGQDDAAREGHVCPVPVTKYQLCEFRTRYTATRTIARSLSVTTERRFRFNDAEFVGMIIGIDFGATNSLMSVFTDDGPVLIPNAVGAILTSSAVHMDADDHVIVGASARDHLVNNPGATAGRFKRLMGAGKPTLLKKKPYSPEDLSSLVLRTLRADAEAYLGQEVTEAVISVPA